MRTTVAEFGGAAFSNYRLAALPDGYRLLFARAQAMVPEQELKN
jgi:hypothetical protein